jgi:hypothetical protein
MHYHERHAQGTLLLWSNTHHQVIAPQGTHSLARLSYQRGQESYGSDAAIATSSEGLKFFILFIQNVWIDGS